MERNKTGKQDSLRVTFKYTAILICFFMVLMMAWEGQKTDAAVAEMSIPQDSIRLRILANSDAAGDQLVKRQIRDSVVDQMNQWVALLEDPQSLEQARTLIRSHLPELNALVARELNKRGIEYGYNVELGVVPFPTKMYGGKVYPAGEYEAVRITLGAGKGQNWWCVLFPPLCFIDAGSGDAAAPAAAKAKTASAAAAGEGAKVKTADQGAVTTASVNTAVSAASGEAETPKVRFFFWELLEKLWSWISGLFS
ncbi:stage II sporulation protein R [Paenibacillus helianthi]|uniref:Stage II sporulation protein R n=1 Tax=Paenibacillus helianthi TaxID=1349432 RepID=A0ABX3EM19_9BACL|nr:stage II sporulation protein R [Paenibacillus helianthi]OKP85885.1 stage II sporulation protein R [Paenibacillus helianthi]